MYKIIKRAFDIIFSLTMLIILSPLMLVISLIVLTTSGRPIIYKHMRMGSNKQPFTIYKFRSLVNGARTRIIKGEKIDYLTTPIGSYLRRLHIDELPQFLNVLIGDMSVVGPRPLDVEGYDKYSSKVTELNKLISVRPGLTSNNSLYAYEDNKSRTPYQLKKIKEIKKKYKSSKISKYFLDRVAVDIAYINQMSPIGDLKIIFRTAMLIVRQVFHR